MPAERSLRTTVASRLEFPYGGVLAPSLDAASSQRLGDGMHAEIVGYP
jgi:hypothetical protein